MLGDGKHRYDHVIFDFDGVIADSGVVAIEEYRRLRRDLFPALPDVRSRLEFGAVIAGSLTTCLHEWLSPPDARAFWVAHAAAVASRSPEIGVFDEVARAVVDLGVGRTSIVTGAHGAAVEAILGRSRVPVRRHFRAILTRETEGSKAAKLRSIVDAVVGLCGRAVYIGDTESDSVHCRDVPMDMIAVAYGYQTVEQVARGGPVALALTPGDLRRVLSGVVQGRGALGA